MRAGGITANDASSGFLCPRLPTNVAPEHPEGMSESKDRRHRSLREQSLPRDPHREQRTEQPLASTEGCRSSGYGD
jgi:hypothetical protein